jgi:hypothetical protein
MVKVVVLAARAKEPQRQGNSGGSLELARQRVRASVARRRERPRSK